MTTRRSTSARDFFASAKDAEKTLSWAETNAATVWETAFVFDLRKRWMRWRMGMFLSEAQFEHLKRIASSGKPKPHPVRT